MPDGDDFRVPPEDLRAAGDQAAVADGLAGFTLAEAAPGCGQAWEDDLGSVRQTTHTAGTALHDSAATYERTDGAISVDFDAAAGALRPGG